MFARLAAFVIWSLVAATAVFWVLRFGARGPQAPAYAMPVDRTSPVRGDLARLFGTPAVVAATAVRSEASSRFRLVGVMAPKSRPRDESASYGFALIAVDGKPAKAYMVGARLDSGLVLQSVGLRTASLGPAQGARSVLLELPTLPSPATGVLPVPGTGTMANAVGRAIANPTPPAAPIAGIAVPQPPAMQAQPVPPAANPPPNMPAADDARSQ